MILCPFFFLFSTLPFCGFGRVEIVLLDSFLPWCFIRFLSYFGFRLSLGFLLAEYGFLDVLDISPSLYLLLLAYAWFGSRCFYCI